MAPLFIMVEPIVALSIVVFAQIQGSDDGASPSVAPSPRSLVSSHQGGRRESHPRTDVHPV